MPLFPIVGLMFIRLCTTSKCNKFTYNTSLYTRENKEKENVRQIIGEKEKDREKRKTSETQKKRTRKTPNTSN
jgi:cell shape-determining protein MreC